MKRITLAILLAFFALAQTAISQTHKRIKINSHSQANVNRLADLGIDLRCGATHHEHSSTIDISNEELGLLRENNISYQVVIDNLNEFYQKNSTKDIYRAQREFQAERTKTLAFRQGLTQRSSVALNTINNYLQYIGATEEDWNVPLNFPDVTSSSEVPMGGALTISQVLTELDEMRAYSQSKGLNIVSEKADASGTLNMKTWGNPLTTIPNPLYDNMLPENSLSNPEDYIGVGTTAQRFDPQTIYYIRITGNESSTTEGTKPQILYTSMIHSRELSAQIGNIFFMWYLIENYDCNPAIKELVDNNELYFIPVVNPDGLKWNEVTEPFGGGMQRKNLRPNTNSSSLDNRGVDLNRNFDYFWGNAGSGSSPSTSSSGYRGPAAASEPETKIIVKFVESRNFKTAVWQHTFANSIPHPYGGNPSFVSGREDEMQKWHEDMTKYNRYVSGATIFPPANGIADDWMLGGAEDDNGSYGAVPFGLGTTPMRILATTPENGSSSEASGNGFTNNGANQGFWPTRNNIIPIAKRMLRINLMNAYYGGRYAKFHDLTPSNLLSGQPASNLTTDLTFGVERVGQTDGNFTLTIIPIQNIQSIAIPTIAINGLNSLVQTEVSSSITLTSGIQPNERIIYKVQLANSTGAIFYDATYEKIYQPNLLFQDNPDSNLLSNWTTGGNEIWTAATVSGASYNSGANTKGIKLGGNNNNAYGTFRDATITTKAPYDFSADPEYLIQFFAKWDIERNYDFVEVLASINGGAYQPLEGKYTKPAATTATNDHTNNSGAPQASNSSGIIYDGDLYDQWKMEEIVIDSNTNSFLLGASNVRIRFRFVSDDNNVLENYSSTPTGFYFDDFRIMGLDVPCDATLEPNNIEVKNISFTTADASWSNISGSTYDLRYRETGSSTWTLITNISGPTQALSGLNNNTEYEVQVATRCSSSVSSFSESVKFTTLNLCENTISTFPYSESFEASSTSTGDWDQSSDDTLDWTNNSGETPSGAGNPDQIDKTGPSQASDGNNYLFTESSGSGSNKSAWLDSPCFDLSGLTNPQFSFDYHMFGLNMGDLTIQVSTDGINYTIISNSLITTNSNNPGLNPISGQQQGSQTVAWRNQTVDLSDYDDSTIKLRIIGDTGSNYTSDLAIDNFNFTADVATAGPNVITQNITVNLDATGNATITEDAVNNGSTGTGTLIFDTDITSFTCANIGANTVTLTVTDDNGSDTGTAIVTIVDTSDPITPTLSPVTVDCNGTLAAPTTTDNCAGTVTGTTTDTLSFVEGGSTTITWTFDDGNGNAINVNQTYNYDDTSDPIPNVMTLTDATGQCSATISSVPTATDNCGGTITGTTTDSLTSSTHGTTTVTWTFDDGNGNSSTQTQNIVVNDMTAPVCATQDITIQLDGTGNASITANDIDNGSSDNCGIASISVSPNTFNSSDIGDNVVTFTVTDINGLSTICNATVSVEDMTLDIDDDKIEIFSISPNPFKDDIRIKKPSKFSGDTFSIVIYDLNGRRVYSETRSANNNQISLNGLSRLEIAPYMIRITNTSSNSVFTSKLIKY